MDDADRESRQPSSGEPGDAVIPPVEVGDESPAPAVLPAVNAALPERLEHVIDDTDGREDAVVATANQLVGGLSFEEVTAELVAAGWTLDAAESIVEEAREATKRERGVRTREDVVIDASRKFGKTIRRVRWIIIIGIVIVGIAVWMILNNQGE